MSKQKVLQPALRFEGFEGDWERKTLGDDVANIVGGGTPDTLNTKYWNGEIDWYSPTEIGLSPFAYSSVKKITQLGLGASSAKLLPAEKTILFTSRAGIGDMAILKKIATTNQGFQSLVLKEGFDPYFVYSMGFLIKNYAMRIASGSTFLEISGKLLGQMDINCPSSNEQIEIGKLFKAIDQQLKLHQTKHTKLKQLKKAMLIKMFPKEGEKVPEIRFAGFSGDWEETTIGNCTNLLTGHPFNSKKFVKNGIFLVRGMNVKRGYIDTTKPTSEYWVAIDGLDMYLLQEKDIVIQMDGALIGKSYAKVSKAILPALLVQRVTRIRCDKVDADFIYQYIQRDFLKHISGIKTETAVPHLSLNDIKSFCVNIPSLKEQTKIGNYFQNLDRLISLQQQQIDKLQNIKKALLEKMFV